MPSLGDLAEDRDHVGELGVASPRGGTLLSIGALLGEPVNENLDPQGLDHLGGVRVGALGRERVRVLERVPPLLVARVAVNSRELEHLVPRGRGHEHADGEHLVEAVEVLLDENAPLFRVQVVRLVEDGDVHPRLARGQIRDGLEDLGQARVEGEQDHALPAFIRVPYVAPDRARVGGDVRDGARDRARAVVVAAAAHATDVHEPGLGVPEVLGVELAQDREGGEDREADGGRFPPDAVPEPGETAHFGEGPCLLLAQGDAAPLGPGVAPEERRACLAALAAAAAVVERERGCRRLLHRVSGFWGDANWSALSAARMANL